MGKGERRLRKQVSHSMCTRASVTLTYVSGNNVSQLIREVGGSYICDAKALYVNTRRRPEKTWLDNL